MTPQPHPHRPSPPHPGAALPSCSLGAAAGGAVVRRRRLGLALPLGRRSFRLPGRPCAAPARSVTFPSSWVCGSGLPEPLVLRRGECGGRGPVLGAGQPRPWGTGRWPAAARGRMCPRKEPAASRTLSRPTRHDPRRPCGPAQPLPFPCGREPVRPAPEAGGGGPGVRVRGGQPPLSLLDERPRPRGSQPRAEVTRAEVQAENRTRRQCVLPRTPQLPAHTCLRVTLCL